MNITLDQKQMMDLCSAAILQAISEEQRAILIKNAIEHLMTPQDTGYHRKGSPLSEAFNRAMEGCAVKIALEFLESNDDLKVQMRQLYTDACTRIFKENREATINKVAEALTRGMAYQER